VEKTRHSSISDSSIVGSCEREGLPPNASEGKAWPTPATLTSKNASRPARWASSLYLRSVQGVAACLGLVLSGCPTGTELDTSYEEYFPTPTTGVKPSTNSSSSTTSGDVTCDDSNVNDLGMSKWCGTDKCHGDVGLDNARAPLWLFSPTRSTDFLNRPALTQGCEAELLVNTENPAASLIYAAIRFTSPCGLEMPAEDYPIPVSEEQACIEEWVLGLAADGAGN